jgi:hypothetical protein
LSEAPAGEWIEDAALSLSLSLDSLEMMDPGRDVCDRSAVLAQHRISLLIEKGMHRSHQKGRGNGRREMSNLSQRVCELSSRRDRPDQGVVEIHDAQLPWSSGISAHEYIVGCQIS